MKKYTVIDIYEDDFGCEGIPENEEPKVFFVLEDELHNKITVSQADDGKINVEDKVLLDSRKRIQKV